MGTGPCDLLEVFPQDLEEYNANGMPTGNTLADVSGFGRLHGMLPDPLNRYFNVNIFAPGGGYVGIIDAETKEAVSLFRVTEMNTSAKRSVHMSFWKTDGSAIIVANLHGKVVERIDLERDSGGKIERAKFNRSASLGVGKGMQVNSEATVFLGPNQHNTNMIGEIVGEFTSTTSIVRAVAATSYAIASFSPRFHEII